MPLIQLWETSPDIVLQYNIKQIVGFCGDGTLADSSECSHELKHYLSNVSVEKLREHVDYCLANSFDKSGFVLQDIVNQLGKRLDYHVEDGLYQGKRNLIGADGIWKTDEHSLVIEVKTSDTYRINLDTVANYRNKLIESNLITTKSSILIVVGRDDTGDLEAQIRGSRHAWDTRIISAEALVKLVELKLKSDEEETTDKIRSLLRPFEYTRLDNIIDVMFTTAKDVESSDEITELEATDESNDVRRTHEQTPREVLDKTRNALVNAICKKEKITLIAHKRAQFSSSDKMAKAVCIVSRQYEGDGYWFVYHPRYNTFLSEAERGYFMLGCIGKSFGYAIPNEDMQKLLPSLNIRHLKDTTKSYWFVHLDTNDHNGYDMRLKGGERLDLETYKINLVENTQAAAA